MLAFLLAGFTLDAASAFTTAFSRWWGESRGRLATFILRNVVGIPLWVVGLILAVRSPSPPVFGASGALEVLAGVLLGLGAVVQIFALDALRLKAARPSVGDELVARGVYACVRHPIYAGVLLEFAGVVLLKPRQTVVVAVVLGCIWVLVQAWLEELDLVQRMPAYREYMKRVPRFLPSVARRAKA